MTKNSPQVIGIIGSGRLGTAVARLALRAGYKVMIANSRGPESLGLILNVLLPGAIASTVGEVALSSDIIILAVPLNKYKMLSPSLFEGKILIDAMNYWPPTEGKIPEFEDMSSSEYIQSYFSGAFVVKTLNHVAYNELEEHSLAAPGVPRRAILLAGNDMEAKRTVSQFISSIGFDAVDMGNVSSGELFQPDTPLFNARFTALELNKRIE